MLVYVFRWEFFKLKEIYTFALFNWVNDQLINLFRKKVLGLGNL